MSRITVGIDQSLSNTGVSVIERGASPRYFSIETGKMRGVVRLKYITDTLIKILSDISSENMGKEILICREDYAYGGVGDTFNLGEVGGCIDLSIFKSINFCGNGIVEYYKIPPNSWKLLVFGFGAVKKDTQYLLKAYDKTGIKFDNDNIADSYMIALAINKMKDFDFDKLLVKEKFGMISSCVRKKNKITEKSISSIDRDVFVDMVKMTLGEYLVFRKE